MRGSYRSDRFPRVFSHHGFSVLLISLFSSVIAPDVHTATLKERRAEVSYSVNLNAPADAKVVRHSVYVALARSAGLPAREVFGIRIPSGKEGDMTKAQHCWVEWYSPGYGWVVADPADVRKAILEKKITLEQAKPLREYFFGAVDESRIAIGTGRDLILNPPRSGEPLNYFMYPYAEADGKPLNEDLYGFNIGYTIRFKEL